VFSDLLENIYFGQDFLMKEFGIIPKVAWHADAFGHSSTNAKLFYELGYDGFFFGRINENQKAQLIEN
jgi:lysosomal alpha-mannosidase